VRHSDAAGAQAAATAAKLQAGTGASCDVWSLGCLLFELVTGHFLFDAEDWARFYLTVTGDETLMSPAAAAFLLSLPASPSSAGMLTAASGAATTAPHNFVAAAAAATARSAGSATAAGSAAVVTASTAVTVGEVTATSSSIDATAVSSVSEEVADDALHAPASGSTALPPSSAPGLKLVQAWGTHLDATTIAPTTAGGATARTGNTRSGASAPTSRGGRVGAGGGLAALHVPQPSDAPPAPAPPAPAPPAPAPPAPSLADLLPIISPVRMAALQEALPPHLAGRFAELMRSLLVRGVGDRPDLGAMQRMVWEFRAEVRATAAATIAGAGVGTARPSVAGQHP
jgi:serine/threonine protein kinase